MSKYLLDTNILIDMGRGIGRIRKSIIDAGPENCFISAISLAELQTGFEITGNSFEKANIEFCKSHFTIIPISDDILDRFAKSKATQIKTGKKVPDFDLMIASTAQNFKLTVVTHDHKHFSLVEDIKLTDWI